MRVRPVGLEIDVLTEHAVGVGSGVGAWALTCVQADTNSTSAARGQGGSVGIQRATTRPTFICTRQSIFIINLFYQNIFDLYQR